jgi:L-fucose isomerase-like protein
MGKAVDECVAEKVTVLIILQPTISDGNLCLSLARRWKKPVLFWATPTKQDGCEIAANSLVGTHIAASMFGQLGHPFEIVFGMPEDDGFEEEFTRATNLIHTAVKMLNARVGLVGNHSPGYVNVQTDAVALHQELGVQLYHYTMSELLDRMDELSADRVKADVQKVLDMKIPLRGVEVSDLDVASKYYLAMNDMMKEDNLDSLAVRCWSELPRVTGQWPYVAFARMLSEGTSVGCEGDVDGALSCLMANLAGIGPSYISDWLEHDEKSIAIWHTGNSVFDILDPVGSEFGPVITRHFNNDKPAVIEGRITPGQPITILRMWLCDHKYKIAAFEGDTIEPKRYLKGTNGLAEINGLDPRELFDDLCHEGMPHHIVIIQGHHTKTLKKLARMMNIQWVGY